MENGNRGQPSLSLVPTTPLPHQHLLHSVDTPISFTRLEFNLLFNLYGQHVAAGEWRDYALDCLKERAIFSVFRRTGEAPLYRIEKNPQLARRQGSFSIISTTGLILKRGHDLATVLGILRKKLNVVKS